MSCVLDANILLRLIETGSPSNSTAKQAIAIVDQSQGCVLFPQAFYEAWVVATRPIENNGLGLLPDEVSKKLSGISNIFPVIHDTPAVFRRWQEVVATHTVKGVRAHDARYVAAMLTHNVSHILTFNDRDFRNFGSITVWTPEKVMSGDQS